MLFPRSGMYFSPPSHFSFKAFKNHVSSSRKPSQIPHSQYLLSEIPYHTTSMRYYLTHIFCVMFHNTPHQFLPLPVYCWVPTCLSSLPIQSLPEDRDTALLTTYPTIPSTTLTYRKPLDEWKNKQWKNEWNSWIENKILLFNFKH